MYDDAAMAQPGSARHAMTRLSLLIDLASLLTREVDLDALLSRACERVAEALRAERATLWLVDGEARQLVGRVAMLEEVDQIRQPLDRGIAGHVASTGESQRVNDVATDARFDPSWDRKTGFRTRSILASPIRSAPDAPVLGVLQVLNQCDGSFDQEDAAYLDALAIQLGHALSMTTLRSTDESHGLVLRGPFNGIVGRSDVLKPVYERVHKAASTDVTVLLTGETGTGKGLFARAIHFNSDRQTAPFVTVDCTTLPTHLAESELFGHERGAFTSADQKVIGKVETADGGTLFLDEVGELSLETQAKLLRFVQEREFERVGGRETKRANVRIVCATHRDLANDVEQGRFRRDLYFRLNVVEVKVPALRDRGSDEIVRLAEHFVHLFSKRYRRGPFELTTPSKAALVEYAFPGNVRELEHLIESAVVLSDGPELSVRPVGGGAGRFTDPAARSATDGDSLALPPDLTLEEASRRYVNWVLERADGNKTEAAKRLGIGRNTIARLLKKTGD